MSDSNKIGTFIIPPVVKSIIVKCDQARAFKALTDDVALWWPMETHSVFEKECAGKAFEPRVAGHFYATSKSGERALVGVIAVWEPPHRLTFTWHPGRKVETAQIVDIVFSASPDGAGTRVTLTHSGWESLGAEGRDKREMYEEGWGMVLGRRYQDYADSSA
jgi:uncharacterized protein YndB with AHSA1/START domain